MGLVARRTRFVSESPKPLLVPEVEAGFDCHHAMRSQTRSQTRSEVVSSTLLKFFDSTMLMRMSMSVVISTLLKFYDSTMLMRMSMSVETNMRGQKTRSCTTAERLLMRTRHLCHQVSLMFLHPQHC